MENKNGPVGQRRITITNKPTSWNFSRFSVSAWQGPSHENGIQEMLAMLLDSLREGVCDNATCNVSWWWECRFCLKTDNTTFQRSPAEMTWFAVPSSFQQSELATAAENLFAFATSRLHLGQQTLPGWSYSLVEYHCFPTSVQRRNYNFPGLGRYNCCTVGEWGAVFTQIQAGTNPSKN